MSSFDLDIKNYSINELLKMFSLEKPYEADEVDNNKSRLKDRITTQNNLTINSPSGTITISGNVYYNTGTLTHITGTVITKNSTLN